MRRLNEYAQFPGRCFFTQSSDTSHGVLDTGHHVDFGGAVYMSGKLVEEAAGLWGWVSPDEYARLEAERDELILQNEVLSQLLSASDNFADALGTLADRLEAAKATVAA